MFPTKGRRLTILEEMERLAAQEGAQPQTTNAKRFLSQFDGIFGLTETPEEQVGGEPIPYPVYRPPSPLQQYEIVRSNPSQFHIFTDGSCLNNGKKGAKASYAVIILGPSETGPPIAELANTLHVTDQHTNQRAELTALKEAVAYTNEHNLWAQADRIVFWTDSQYALKCITEWGPGWRAKGWKKRDGKPIEHLDILRPLIELKMDKGSKFSIRYVEAHQSAAKSSEFPWRFNARADSLAQAQHT